MIYSNSARDDLKNNVFFVYLFEFFILVRVGALVVKAVYKFTYKQVLAAIYLGSPK